MFLRCLKGMVILYSFQTPKSYLRAGYFSFYWASKVKLQRYPHWLHIYLLGLLLFTLHTWKGEVCPTKVLESFYFLHIWLLEHVKYIKFLFSASGCSDSHFVAALFIFEAIIPQEGSYTQVVSQLFLICLKKPVVLAEMYHLFVAGVYGSVRFLGIFQFGF